MIRVQMFHERSRYRMKKEQVLPLARRVLAGEKRSHADCNIVFIDDHAMKKLNRVYLNHKYPTDVLSFPLGDESSRDVIGEVYVNLDQARRQAKDVHESISTEARRLVIHGILHLCGYRDSTKARKGKMMRKQEFYLQNQ